MNHSTWNPAVGPLPMGSPSPRMPTNQGRPDPSQRNPDLNQHEQPARFNSPYVSINPQRDDSLQTGRFNDHRIVEKSTTSFTPLDASSEFTPRSARFAQHERNPHSEHNIPSPIFALPPTVQRTARGPCSRPAEQDGWVNQQGQSNPFDTPDGSKDSSRDGSRAVSTAISHSFMNERYFHSRRVKKGKIEKPWLNKKDPRAKWATFIPLIGLIIGFGISGFLVYLGLQSVVEHVYCSVYEDDFSSGLDSSIWTKEAEVGGYGNGQFEETTTTEENVFIKNGMLYIKPTLQDAHLINTNNVINLTAAGTCSSTLWSDCVTATNTTNGTIVNPVHSGRISTKPRKGTKGASIRYGRVEVTAKLVKGDWLWPAIWLLPVNNTYGAWPASGEIDIAESRGNNFSYPLGGNNIVSSTLHWGPDSENDAWWRTTAGKDAFFLTKTYADQFHTFGLEWSEKYLFTYIDSRLIQVVYAKFTRPIWDLGKFPVSTENGTSIVDPWSQTGRDSTPFDQDFYLILNVAVGGTNGWFTDGKNGKPWVDASPTAKRDFWDAQGEWYPTWQGEGKGEMVIKSVKMWQQKGYNGC